MTERVTLELPEDVARSAYEIAQRTGQSLENVLTDWLRHSAFLNNPLSLIKPGDELPIYTPYGNEEAAQVLWDALQSGQARPPDIETGP